jgi:hypothetical protein
MFMMPLATNVLAALIVPSLQSESYGSGLSGKRGLLHGGTDELNRT